MSENTITFACHTYYHLYISTIYARNLKKNHNVRISLVWYGAENNPFIASFKSVFNKVYNLEKISLFQNKGRFKKKLIYYYRLNALVRYIKLLILPNVLFNKGAGKNILCVFSDQPIEAQILINANKRKNINNINIIIDEGLGLYFNQRELVHYTNLFRTMLNLVKIVPQSNSIMGEHPLLDSIIARKPSDLPNHLLDLKKNIIYQNINQIFKKSSIMNYLKLLSINTSIIPWGENKNVIIIGQPLKFCGLDEEFELKIWQEIINYIPSSINVIIKPHPTDNVNKYDSLKLLRGNIFIIEKELSLIPIEILLVNIKNAVTMSAFSSVAINVKYINKDIKNIFLYELFGLLETITKEQIKLMNMLGIIVNNYDEIVTILKVKPNKDDQKRLDGIHKSGEYMTDMDYFERILKS